MEKKLNVLVTSRTSKGYWKHGERRVGVKSLYRHVYPLLLSRLRKAGANVVYLDYSALEEQRGTLVNKVKRFVRAQNPDLIFFDSTIRYEIAREQGFDYYNGEKDLLHDLQTNRYGNREELGQLTKSFMSWMRYSQQMKRVYDFFLENYPCRIVGMCISSLYEEPEDIFRKDDAIQIAKRLGVSIPETISIEEAVQREEKGSWTGGEKLSDFRIKYINGSCDRNSHTVASVDELVEKLDRDCFYPRQARDRQTVITNASKHYIAQRIIKQESFGGRVEKSVFKTFTASFPEGVMVVGGELKLELKDGKKIVITVKGDDDMSYSKGGMVYYWRKPWFFPEKEVLKHFGIEGFKMPEQMLTASRKLAKIPAGDIFRTNDFMTDKNGKYHFIGDVNQNFSIRILPRIIDPKHSELLSCDNKIGYAADILFDLIKINYMKDYT